MNSQEKETCINLFLSHSINLSYEYITHKKNLTKADCYLAIPNGKKYFVWFTKWNKKNVCFFLEVYYNKIVDISIKNVPFHFPETIFYGTFFVKKNIKIFSVENIFYYKNQNIVFLPFYEKLHYIKNFFHSIQREIPNPQFVYFVLPLMDISYSSLLEKINNFHQNIYFIQCIKNNHFQNIKYNEIKKNTEKSRATFLVKPELTNDIYYLYTKEKNAYKKFQIAYIPNIKTSYFMNSLFRNIKENTRLDLLEESDEEEEFENIDIYKYVYINKEIPMLCEYNTKFKGWIPLGISKNEIISGDKLKSFVG